MFNENIPIKDKIKQYVRMVDRIATTSNFAWRSEVCGHVSKTVRSIKSRYSNSGL